MLGYEGSSMEIPQPSNESPKSDNSQSKPVSTLALIFRMRIQII